MHRADVLPKLCEIFLWLFESNGPENVKAELPDDFHIHSVAVVRSQLIIRHAAQRIDRIAYTPATWKISVNRHTVDVVPAFREVSGDDL